MWKGKLPSKNDLKVLNNIIFLFFSVGEFEADALLVPNGCKFDHLHKSDKCKSHDQWKNKAASKCKEQGKHLHGYGVLLPCAVDKFTGVEFVCCPKKHKKHQTMKPTSSEVPTEAETPTTASSELEKLVSQFEKSVPEKSVGKWLLYLLE